MAQPTSRLAIDLSGGLIRVVKGSVGGRLLSGSGGTPAGSIVGGKVLNPAGVGSALKQLLARTEISDSKALVAASDAVATFRVLQLAPAVADQDVDATVARELLLDPERMTTRWIDVGQQADHRLIYAVAWDRTLIKSITDAIRQAGLEPLAVDLKSACQARTVAASECLIVDLTSNPVEIVLIDAYVPRVWRSFRFDIDGADDVAQVLAGPVLKVLRFYERRRDSRYPSTAPVYIAGEPALSAVGAFTLSEQLGHPVTQIPLPARVTPDIRYPTYLTCLGLLMRRSA